MTFEECMAVALRSAGVQVSNSIHTESRRTRLSGSFCNSGDLAMIQASKPSILLWHVDLLLGNDRETNSYNGFANKRVCMATIRKQQQRNDVFYAVRAEM
jgi:hypothetical protein